jgi:hypothetical protein
MITYVHPLVSNKGATGLFPSYNKLFTVIYNINKLGSITYTNSAIYITSSKLLFFGLAVVW